MARKGNGSTGYIESGDLAQSLFSSAYTVAFWFKPSSNVSTSISTTPLDISSAETPDPSFRILFQWHNTVAINSSAFIHQLTSGVARKQLSSPPTSGQWAHLILTWDGSNIQVYQNGTIDGSPVTAASINSAGPERARLLAYSSAHIRFSDDTITGFGIWKVALGSSDRAALAAGAQPNTIDPSNLVLSWNLQGGSPEPDSSGNSRNGTVTPTVTTVSDSPQFGTSHSYQSDVYAVSDTDKLHYGDVFVKFLYDKKHSVDAYAVTSSQASYLKLSGNIRFSIDSNAYIRMNALIAESDFDFLKLAATVVRGSVRSYINLSAFVAARNNSYLKLKADLSLGASKSHSADFVVAIPAFEYLKLIANLVNPLSKTHGGVFPDNSFMKLAAWVVSPVAGQNSKQVPGTGAEDWNSSQQAASLYNAISLISLDGVSLVVTSFTPGVVSFQTRTRQWLRRVDEAPSGVLVSEIIENKTLTTGQVVKVTTRRSLFQDTETVEVVTEDEGQPETTRVEVRELTKSGKEVTRETQTTTTNGVKHTLEKKIVASQPPTTTNRQPIKVRTLDGEEHQQWFGLENPNWVGGDAEGTTTTERSEQIVPGVLNGSNVDASGNPILAKVVDEKVTTPDGRVVETHTETIGVQNEAGSTVTDTEREFDGITTTEKTIVTNPDGSQQVTEKTVNNQTGNSVEVTTVTQTNELGQTTTTVSVVERVTFTDTDGKLRSRETTTVHVTKDGITTTDTTVTTRNDFEDDIVANKIKVILIQEFTITCMIDLQNMYALMEKNITHQQQFALLELFGQQLGNANLSWPLRQRLINQFEEATERLTPVRLQALGKVYDVVFAPSGSAFRPRYIIGSEPHLFELQMILQERADLITGTREFGL